MDLGCNHCAPLGKYSSFRKRDFCLDGNFFSKRADEMAVAKLQRLAHYAADVLSGIMEAAHSI